MNPNQVAIKMTAHALVASVMPDTPPVVGISVARSNGAVGYVRLGQTEPVALTREHLMSRLVTTLAGTAAIRAIEGDVSEVTYADDLGQVYSIARHMVDNGMSILDGKGFELDVDDMHAEIERIVAEVKELAERIVECDRERIEAVAAVLIERETLDGDDFAAVLSEHPSRVTPDMVEFKSAAE